MSDGEIIKCYLIEPKNIDNDLPVIFYTHGGGFFAPISKSMFENAFFFANNLNCRVFMPEYRLTPKYTAPTQSNDCYESLIYIYDHFKDFKIDINKIITYGESAGGCLATLVCQRAYDENKCKIIGQVLIYPVIDNNIENYDSMSEYNKGVFSNVTADSMWKLYLKNSKKLKYSIPINRINFKDLPPAYIEPHEIDVFRDEAICYGKKLWDDNVYAEINLIIGSYHGVDSERYANYFQKILKHRCKIINSMFKKEFN